MTQGHFSGFGSLPLHMCTLTSLVKCSAYRWTCVRIHAAHINHAPSPTLPKICDWFTDTLAFNPVKVHAILALNLPFPLGGRPHSSIKAPARTSLPSSSSNPPITDYQSTTRPVLTQASTARLPACRRPSCVPGHPETRTYSTITGLRTALLLVAKTVLPTRHW